MNDFILMVDTFGEALHNLRIFFQISRENNISLSNEKCFMIMTEGIVLGCWLSGSSPRFRVNKSTECGLKSHPK